MKANIFKRSLSALMAAIMAGSMLAVSVSADGLDPNEWVGTWTTANERTKNTAIYNGEMYDLRGDAKDSRDPDTGDIVIDAEMMGTMRQPIWGMEMPTLAPTTYTIVFKVKLVDDKNVDGDFIYCAIDPKVHDRDNWEKDKGMPEWMTLNDVRAYAANADASGYFNLYYVVSPEKYGYTENLTSKNFKIEIRLSGPSEDPSLTNVVAAEGGDVELRVNQVSLYRGYQVPTTALNNEWFNGRYYENGVAVTTQKVVKDKYGDTYGILEGGAMAVNQLFQDPANPTNYYFFGSDGKAIKNAFATDPETGKEYYFEATGIRAKTAKKVFSNGKTYYINSNGEKVKNGWGGNSYYGADGVMVVNKIINGTYGVDAAGLKITNKVAKVAGKRYAFGADGKILGAGKRKVGKKYTYVNKDKTVTVNAVVGKKYITDGSGYLIKDKVKKIGNKTYAVSSKYTIITGSKVAKVGSKKYAIKKGLVSTAKSKHIVKIGSKNYAVNANGTVMKKTKKVKIGKKYYTVNKDGVAKVVKK